MNKQQRFLAHASRVIQDDPNHPLRFLLNENGQVSTMANRRFSIHTSSEFANGKSHIKIERPKGDRTPSEDIARAFGGTVVSCDACHVQSRMSGMEERFALGIAGEDNRSHGKDEANLKKQGFFVEHETVSIGDVPVIRSSADQWEAAGLLRQGTVESSKSDLGWSESCKQSETSEQFWASVKRDASSVGKSESPCHQADHRKSENQRP